MAVTTKPTTTIKDNIMNKYTLMNAINNSKFAKNAFDNDYAFDITIDGVTYEVCPKRLTYNTGISILNKSTREISYL